MGINFETEFETSPLLYKISESRIPRITQEIDIVDADYTTKH
jgi:hypothetical protein